MGQLRPSFVPRYSPEPSRYAQPILRPVQNYKALCFFDAISVDEAQPAAKEVIAGVSRCPRCSRVLAQRFDRLGSNLFYDDDPRELSKAFDSADRDGCTLRLLAACIILFGRERMALGLVH